MPKILLKNGRVVDPLNKVDDVLDVFVENGAIKQIDKNISASADKVIDVADLIVCPGLIDMHVHLREPGREDEETIESGTKAAVKGGFTCVVCMPNTDPVADSAPVVEYVKEKTQTEGLVRVLPVGAITKGLKGKELAPMAELMDAGAVAFSDDGESIMDAEVMRRALEYSIMLNTPIIVHAEDKKLSANGQINEGLYSTMLGLKGIPTAAEEVMVARDIILAEMTGAKIHIAHVSTAGSVELIRGAKERGVNVTCEVTPQHLILTEAMTETFDTNYKVNPPLRSEVDVLALREGLKDGTIDVIASDHAPHALHEKEREFQLAPFGIIGLETTLSLILTELVKAREFSLYSVVEKLTVNPAKILGLDLGSLSIGSPADIMVFDPNVKVKVDVNSFESKSKNSPFGGWELYGVTRYVLVGGNLVLEEGKSLKG
ncbi:MAG: dihydroorotase [Candidatus Subteraquimicrobiales bacterium]|nr:dihydroorotase [Candidatus Subteraquimicrobiales bacterium]